MLGSLRPGVWQAVQHATGHYMPCDGLHVAVHAMTRALHGPFGKPGMSACTTVQLMSQVLKPIWNRVPDVRVLHGCTAWSSGPASTGESGEGAGQSTHAVLAKNV
mmetsp:Transcript_31419/g.69976  ORF Transcript_31419/g.69976 Transcript_31419/m.69976 type:complete len:105 (+) Transcript_31419:336-650(+)